MTTLWHSKGTTSCQDTVCSSPHVWATLTRLSSVVEPREAEPWGGGGSCPPPPKYFAISLDPTKLPCIHMVTKAPAYAHSIWIIELCGQYIKKQHALPVDFALIPKRTIRQRKETDIYQLRFRDSGGRKP